MNQILSKKGIIKKCSVCNNKIWINLKWPGLPIWDLPKPGKQSRPFFCSWCNSKICLIRENNNPEIVKINILKRENNFKNIDINEPFLFDKETLVEFFKLLLLSFYSPANFKNNKDRFYLNVNYKEERQMVEDINNKIMMIMNNSKCLPLPVLEE